MTVIEKQYMDSAIAINRRPQSRRPDRGQRWYEIAKGAMCAILGNPAIVDEVTEEGGAGCHRQNRGDSCRYACRGT